jgi:hypothetical protein
VACAIAGTPELKGAPRQSRGGYNTIGKALEQGRADVNAKKTKEISSYFTKVRPDIVGSLRLGSKILQFFAGMAEFGKQSGIDCSSCAYGVDT